MAASAPLATRVGVGVVVCTSDRRVLLGRRVAEPGRPLAIPGGKLDPGESIEECAVRELAEETGLVVDLADARAFGCVLHRDDRASWLIAGVEARLGLAAAQATPQVTEPEKFAALQWVDPDAPPPDLFPATAALLAQWLT